MECGARAPLWIGGSQSKAPLRGALHTECTVNPGNAIGTVKLGQHAEPRP